MRARRQGWTLVEALVALAIIALALLMVADGAFYGVMWGRNAEGRVLSTLVSQSVVDEIADHEYGDKRPPVDWEKDSDGWARTYQFMSVEEGAKRIVEIKAKVTTAEGGNGSFFGRGTKDSDLLQAQISFSLRGQEKSIKFRRTVAR